jgi:cytochrome c-type biogenesis protein CcmE
MKLRQKRIALIAGGLITIGVATALVMNALNSNIAFFVTPTEVLDGKAPQDKAFRIGGLVKEGSIRRDNLTVHFLITDTAKDVPVTYTGILPEGRKRRGGPRPHQIRWHVRGHRGAGQARRKLHAGGSAARH